MINFCLAVKPGDSIFINAGVPGEELALEAYQAGIQAGAHPTLYTSFPGADEILYKYGSDAQLEFVPPIMKMYEDYDRILFIYATENTRSLSGVDPLRRAKWLQANKTWFKLMNTREGLGAWCSTMYPTYASAQEANMSLADFKDFVFHAGMLDAEDPIAAWRALSAKMHTLADWLNTRSQIVLKGSDIDMRLAFTGRKFISTDVKANFPGGEIFTCPLEDFSRRLDPLPPPGDHHG